MLIGSTGLCTLNTTERCTRPGNPPLVTIGSTGLGTFNTTERCTRPGNLGADIGSTQYERNVESYGMPLVSKIGSLV